MAAEQSEPRETESLDLHAYWRTIVRRRWMIVPFFLATVAVTAFVTLRQTKIYDATCTIVIDLAAPRVLEKEQVQDVVESGTGGYWYSREYYETQYKVIASRAVAQRVADRLQLATNARFLGVPEGSVGPGNPARDPVGLLQKGLKIEPVKESRIVRLRFEDPDPALAAQIANGFAEAYIAENLSVKTTTTASASEWLEEQLAELEQKLDESGKALFDFKKAHDIVAATWDDRQGMVSQRMTAINDALTKARVRKAELEARNQSVDALAAALAQDRLDAIANELQLLNVNPAIENLKLKYYDVATECADLKVKYLQDHPKLEACEQKRALIKAGLEREVKGTLDAARSEYQEVSRSERNLTKLLDDAKADAFGLNQYERDYLELKRSYDNNQRLYELVLKRLKDTSVTGMLQVSNVRILDRARPGAAPVRPSPRKNIGLAIILGIIGGIALAFAAEAVDTSITSQEQIEEKLGLTFLGIVPRIPPNKDGTPQDLIVHTQPKSAAAECVRAVRTNLLFMSPEKPLRTILVTSSGPQEGKTTTVTSLAVTMTTSGNRVLIVDADMRRPRLHRIFGVKSEVGLSSLILGEGSIDEAVIETAIPNLSILPCGPVPPNPAELLHTASFARLLNALAERYDRIILDSPPVGVVADAVVISTRVDGALVVLKAGTTSREVARQSVRQLRDVNAPLFGAVLNDLDLEDQKYGQYSYYYRYGYYYGDSRRDDKGGRADAGPTAA
ncbi:MAG: polysaccharide biosynthesis tyrosine autokinase [Anaeromyxobacter sp.]